MLKPFPHTSPFNMFVAIIPNMNRYILTMVVALVALATTSRAQNFPSTPRPHFLDVGVLGGYNLDTKGPVFGGGIGYEYRPYQRWGFVANLNYDFTRSDESSTWHVDIPGVAGNKADYWGQEMYSASLGARHYFGRFFVGASFGLAHERNWVKMDDGVRSAANTRYGFYQHYYAGYQIPLKNNSYLEFVGSASGAGALKTTVAARYKFGF